MNSPSYDVKDMLEAESALGLVFGTNLFIGSEPTNPKNTTTIFDTSGYPPQLTLTKGENYYYPSIQIRIRNTSYATGWSLIHDIMESLHGRSQETWNSTLYSVIRCSISPAFLDRDDNGLYRFVCTFDLQRR